MPNKPSGMDFSTTVYTLFANISNPAYKIHLSYERLKSWEYFEDVHFHTSSELTPCNWALLERLTVVQLLKNFLAYYGTHGLITMFTRFLCWSLSWTRSIQSIPPHLIPPGACHYPPTYVFDFLVDSFLLAFPSTIYMHTSFPVLLNALPTSSSLTWSF
jgi:hypothetical protein